jgi:tetratricopeptide (TPR) repeat protein
MASPRDPRDPRDPRWQGRWPPPGAPSDEVDAPSSDDTTVLPGLSISDDDADDETNSDAGFREAPITAADGRAVPAEARRDTPVVELRGEVDIEVFVEPRTSVSGAYASLSAQGDRSTVASPFSSPPPPDEPAPVLFAPLPEMSVDIWNAGVRALVTVPESVMPPWTDDDYWRELGGMFMDELALADAGAPQVELTMAAARVAERLADGAMALRLVDDALTLAPDDAAAWRARARLLEGAGDNEGAHEAWRQLRARAGDEQDVYTALDGEWTLARRGALDGLEGPSLDAIPDGPARALAEAEVALLRGTPADVATALEQAAFGSGGAVGAALLEAAARFHEVGGDASTAADQRFVAARMDAGSAAPPLGRLRDAARFAPAEAEEALAELRAELGPSALGDAVARWAAGLARTRGDGALAREILAAAAGPEASAALVRDRLDLDLELGVPADAETFRRARATTSAPAAVAMLGLREAAALAAQGAPDLAVERLREAVARAPDALPLGLLAEDLARHSAEPDVRIAALELWLGVDPARRAAAALALADELDARGGPGAELATRGALQTVLEAAPGSAAFWTTAARDARAGRIADAAATMAFGAELWAGSRLGAPLAERAAEMAALASAEGALADLHGLATAGPAELERLLTIARGVTRAGSSADRHASLTDQVGIFTDVQTRAWWWARRAQTLAPGSSDERVACLDAALDKAPGHPVALALLLGDPMAGPVRTAAALARAGVATDNLALRIAAVHVASLAGELTQARDLGVDLVAAQPGAPAAVELAVELARLAGGASAAADIVARLPTEGDDAHALSVAEALEGLGETARAAELLEGLTRGPLAPDARRARARLSVGSPGAGLPMDEFAGPFDAAAEEAEQALARLRRAAEQGRSAEVVWALEKEPPHEEPGGWETLFSAGLREDGDAGGDARRATALFATAMADGAARLACVSRVAEGATDTARAAVALQLAASLVGGGETPAAPSPGAATFLRRAADAFTQLPDDARAERCLREAVAADGEHLPAVMALRRLSARRRDLETTVEICAWEARILRGPEARVRALLRAAELARHDDTETAPPPNRHVRALGLYRQALDVDPSSEAAFTGLRALLEENGAHGVLAEAFASRVAAARNPFEITALRLARAELLAGPLDDRAAAKLELETILQKEPQHARALARLSDLVYEEGAFAEAGELYLRRAVVERAPDVLREILLRLGRIYTTRVPDAKRAIGAYARVLQTEPQNHEALAALSDLYLQTGDMKHALVVTEALVPHEREAARRLGALVRAGQLHERLGDLRQAGVRFRQAADEAPRDVVAVSELARFLERTRDPVGRRALLDHAVGLLRHDVERGRFDRTTLRALGPLLQARGKARAAASAAQLLAAVSEDATEREAARTWAAAPPRGRRLSALARPEIDERTFPPALLPGMRHIFRLAGPTLAKTAGNLARHGVGRAERLARGQVARDVVDGVAAELGVADVDVFVRAATPAGIVSAGGVRVEPGERAAIILGAELPTLGGHALRFAAARALRLVATHLDLVLAGSPADAGALLAGLIRQFVPDFAHPGVRDELVAVEAERISKLLPRKLKTELMPFAVESAGAFDLEALHAAVRDGANAVGLLASGDLPASLAALLAGSGATLEPADLVRHAEALALVRFALSDDYDELAQSME